MPKKPIIIISVLCVISLALGYLSGLKDEVSLSNGDAETNSKKEPEFLKEGLVAYYPFNGNAKDESGNGNDGDITGATFEDDRHGINRSACYFDGEYDFIKIRHSETISFSNPDYTIMMWLRFGRQSQYSTLFVKARYGSPYQGITIFNSHMEKGKIDFREVGGGDSQLITKKVDDNIWFHFTIVKRDMHYSIFLNGFLDSSMKIDYGNDRINNNPIWFGANHENQRIQN